MSLHASNFKVLSNSKGKQDFSNKQSTYLQTSIFEVLKSLHLASLFKVFYQCSKTQPIMLWILVKKKKATGGRKTLPRIGQKANPHLQKANIFPLPTYQPAHTNSILRKLRLSRLMYHEFCIVTVKLSKSKQRFCVNSNYKQVKCLLYLRKFIKIQIYPSFKKINFIFKEN